MEKAPEAFRTIGELSTELGVPQHVLRYWETKFPQLKPLQRAGNRRYYRAAEVALARRISHLLNVEGYTVRGVQKLLADKVQADPVTPLAPVLVAPPAETASSGIDIHRLRGLRDRLQDALAV
jgi:DNA-binding transcriptional MerR regulator